MAGIYMFTVRSKSARSLRIKTKENSELLMVLWVKKCKRKISLQLHAIILDILLETGYFIRSSWHKAGLALNDLYDTTCMTHNQFSSFYCVYTIIQAVRTEFIKVFFTDYSAVKSSSKTILEQTAAAVIVALISDKSKSRKKRKNIYILFETLA